MDVIILDPILSGEVEIRNYIYSQLFRLCNANMSLKGFISDVKMLRGDLLHQNFNVDLLNRYIKKFINAKPPCTYKYWVVLDFRLFI
jgi:hypothetical protein